MSRLAVEEVVPRDAVGRGHLEDPARPRWAPAAWRRPRRSSDARPSSRASARCSVRNPHGTVTSDDLVMSWSEAGGRTVCGAGPPTARRPITRRRGVRAAGTTNLGTHAGAATEEPMVRQGAVNSVENVVRARSVPRPGHGPGPMGRPAVAAEREKQEAHRLDEDGAARLRPPAPAGEHRTVGEGHAEAGTAPQPYRVKRALNSATASTLATAAWPTSRKGQRQFERGRGRACAGGPAREPGRSRGRACESAGTSPAWRRPSGPSACSTSSGDAPPRRGGLTRDQFGQRIGPALVEGGGSARVGGGETARCAVPDGGRAAATSAISSLACARCAAASPTLHSDLGTADACPRPAQQCRDLLRGVTYRVREWLQTTRIVLTWIVPARIASSHGTVACPAPLLSSDPTVSSHDCRGDDGDARATPHDGRDTSTWKRPCRRNGIGD